MSAEDLSIWIEENASAGTRWYLKRLSGNDTLANGAHQAGPYIPKGVLFDAIPELNRPLIHNPEHWLSFHLASHDETRQIRAVWYNNSMFGGTRDEARLTNFGGAGSGLLNPESTGAIAVFVFRPATDDRATEITAWVCSSQSEEDVIRAAFEDIEPGQTVVWAPDGAVTTLQVIPAPSSALPPDAIPEAWLEEFPKASEIVARTIELGAFEDASPDERLIKRRKLEFRLFRELEERTEMPRISQGFNDIESFIAVAQTILQRRKARSGRSLELHLKAIFIEEGLIENEQFEHGATIEENKKPDFLFPNAAVYADASVADSALSMLAVKTTCRDRWRQILTEATRIPSKHLFTLQQGLSAAQFAEMTSEHVTLVVPFPLHGKFSDEIAPQLMTLEAFINARRAAS